MMQAKDIGSRYRDVTAYSLFKESVRKGWIYRLSARLGRKNYALQDFFGVICCNRILNSHYTGIRTVPMNSICGTQGRTNDFDASFHPTSDEDLSRWLGVAQVRLCGCGLPPIELVEVNGCYFVRDGHHRISVARSMGEQFIDAEITTISLECDQQAIQDHQEINEQA